MTDPEDYPLRTRHMTSTIQTGDRSGVCSLPAGQAGPAVRAFSRVRVVLCRVLPFLLVLIVCLPALAGLPGREAQKGDMALQWYGDAEDIALLASLLSDADPRVREQAVCNLGQTRNPDALAHVRKALDDTEPAVRRSAVLAAAQLRAPLSEQVVRQALTSDDPETVLTAIAAARLQTWRELADALAKCLGHDQARVRVEALACLTHLGKAAEPAVLVRLLGDPSLALRLRAAENAALAQDASLVEPLLAAAGANNPALTGFALASLGKQVGAKLGETPAVLDAVNQAARSAHPLVRRGAVWALDNAALGPRVCPFLDDPSPLVRLAAVRAAGRHKVAQCVDRLFELMVQAPFDNYLQHWREPPSTDPHLAARESLKAIATDRVAELAAEHLAKLADELKEAEKLYVSASFGQRAGAKDMTPQKAMRRALLERNAAACAYLLGRMGNRRGYDVQLDLVKVLPVDCVSTAFLAEALGRIGDKRAVKPLMDVVAVCAHNGRLALIAQAAQQPPPLPYSHEVAQAVVEALGRLDDPQAAPYLLGIASVNVSTARLNEPAMAAAMVLPQWFAGEHAKAIELYLLTVLKGNGYPMAAQYQAARAAVKLKLQSAIEPLRALMDQRHNDAMIHITSWALSELTGQPVAPPPPRPRPGDWIIRKAGR